MNRISNADTGEFYRGVVYGNPDSSVRTWAYMLASTLIHSRGR